MSMYFNRLSDIPGTAVRTLTTIRGTRSRGAIGVKK